MPIAIKDSKIDITSEKSTKELAKIIGTAGTTVKSREMGIVGMFQGFSPEQLEKAERPQIEGEIDDVS